MLILIDASDGRPIYLQIMDEVRRAVVLGTVGADEPLPSVRQLATELRVNPNTVQQAYRELEREGVVYVRRGQGTFASGRVPEADGRGGVLREVAGRALRDAYRAGAGVEELVDSIRAAAASADVEPGNGGSER